MLAARLNDLRAELSQRKGRKIPRHEIATRCEQVAIDMGIAAEDAPSAGALQKMELLEGGTQSPSGVYLVLLAHVYGVSFLSLVVLTLPVEVRPWAERI